jgi:hypothetical protein
MIYILTELPIKEPESEFAKYVYKYPDDMVFALVDKMKL